MNKLTPFLVTIRFKPVSSGSVTRKSEMIFSLCDRLYSHIVSRLISNQNRKPHLFPLTYNFIDVAGSKYCASSDITHVTSFHLHCIYLVHSAVLVPFERLASEDFKSSVNYRSRKTGEYPFSQVESIHCEAIVPSDVSAVVDYSAKLMKINQFYSRMSDMTFFSQNPAQRPDLDSLPS